MGEKKQSNKEKKKPKQADSGKKKEVSSTVTIVSVGKSVNK